jgi:hypothetical protein
MPVLESELKRYGAASRPEDDVSVSGGAIDAACILDVTQLAANDQIRVVSDNAADTMNGTLRVRNAAGEIVSETLALNGVTPVVFAATAERFLSFSLASAAAGNVTVERNTGPNDDVAILEPGITDATLLFLNSTSEASLTTRYEKEFWRNENATLSLTSAEITLTADPSASIRIGLATEKDDAVSLSDRKTAPGGVTFVDDSIIQSVPTGNLGANEAIGVYIELQRATDAAPIKTSYTTRLAGLST